jgi:selenoprotein W-related protein
LNSFEPNIETLTLIPSNGGRYEIVVNNQLIYSKLVTGRHAEPGEVVDLVKKFLQEGKI